MAIALPLFAVTLFVSAFLLFLVQPMIGKLILPKLGGTPQVWNTCMMFFQTALLLGYGYTHTVSTRLPLRRQLLVHGLLLLVPIAFLLPTPFNIASWVPPSEENPIPATLLLLTMVVGIPFFVVSTSAPLLQRWFSYTGHPAAKDPYFLYGASNLGSLLSLIVYPFMIEPVFTLEMQKWIWTVGYVILGGLIGMSVALVWKLPTPELDAPPSPEATPPLEPQAEASTAIQPAAAMRGVRKKGAKLATGEEESAKGVDISQPRDEAITVWRRIRWVLLAAAPSSLMLGVTSYVSTDLSPFPLLWVIPLALYLLSFILVFSKWPTVWTGTPHAVMLFVGPIAILAMAYILLIRTYDPKWPAFMSFMGFFIVACVCHGELAKDRPTPKHLTEYFLLMSVGGMVGGVFNGLFAPVFFYGVAEYPIAIVVACFLRPKIQQSGWLDDLALKASPDLEKWSIDTGDKTAQAFNAPPPRSTWVVNVAFDILLGVFVFFLAWYLAKNPPTGQSIAKFMRFIGFSQQSAAEWVSVGYRAFIYGIPMLFCFFMATRPIRFGLAVAGLLYVNIALADREGTLVADRSYFGVLRVLTENDDAAGYVEAGFVEPNDAGQRPCKFTYLMHGSTYHGRNYYEPMKLSRLATTYYHRWGPVGIIMERYNWLPGPQNTFWADARMPAAMAGLGTPLAGCSLPLEVITQVWSEPPVATIGLGSGTMASYGRPLSHVVYYEIDEKIRDFSLPQDGTTPLFKYLKGSLERSCNLEVIMGDARLSMQNSTPGPRAIRDAKAADKTLEKIPVGTPRPGSLFHLDGDKIVQDKTAVLHPEREKYYKVIVVDAFSSDAIPVHLITREAIELYMDQLQDDGVLCVHTSNRHLDLIMPVADIASDMGLAMAVGHDPGSERSRTRGREFASLGHFGSEYIMLSRSKDRLKIKNLEKILLDPAKPPNPATNPVVSLDADKMYGNLRQWYVPTPPDMRRWTDDFSNIVSILR